MELLMDVSDSFPIHCKKNYFGWEFQFRMYVKAKELWGHIDGTTTKPLDSTKRAQ